MPARVEFSVRCVLLAFDRSLKPISCPFPGTGAHEKLVYPAQSFVPSRFSPCRASVHRVKRERKHVPALVVGEEHLWENTTIHRRWVVLTSKEMTTGARWST